MKKKFISLLTAFSMTLMMFGTPNIAAATHTNHKVCGDLSCTDSGHTDISNWVSINNLSNLENGKHYYLTNNIYLTSEITIDKNVTLCLNGCTIDAQKKSRIFKINGGSLTLCDCQGGGTLTGGKTDNGGAVYMDSGSFTMYGGTISGNTASGSGGGVYVGGGTFTMSGGTITGNTASNYGGGVYVNASGDKKGTFTMDGGKISGNTARINGGGVYNSGTFKMTGGTIGGRDTDENTAYAGGGVFVNSGTFEMSGDSTISGNKANTTGGGVYVGNSGTFKMTGGTISGNTASSNGGGVFVYSGTFEMSDNSTISDNTAANGGGVFVYSGTFEMSGNSTISGNMARSNGGGVYVDNGTFTMSDNSTISGNTATYGGGVRFYSGTFTINGNVNISDNTKTGDSSANNVALNTGNTINIGNGFDTTFKIGVNTTATPTCAAPVAVTAFAEGASATDISASFTADIDGQSIVNSTGNIVQLKGAHTATKTAANDATCTEDGNVEYWHCSRCNTNFSDSNCTNKLTTTVVTKTGHSATKTAANAATCTADGNKEYWKCTVCETYFSDEACTAEITQASTVVQKTEHSYSTDWSKDLTNHWHECTVCHDKKDIAEHTRVDFGGKAATCTEKGLEAGIKCSVCNTVLDNPTESLALGHDYVNGICTRCPATNPIAGENISWTIEDGTLTIRGTGAMDNFTEDNAPWQNKKGEITKVVIENGVTSVGDNAFSGCTNLKTVTIPDTVTDIGGGAFKGTGLTEVTIPDSVKTIGENAFANTGVKTVYYPEDTDVKGNSFPDSTTQIEYSVNEDGDVIIEDIKQGDAVSDGEKVEIPGTIGGKDVVGVDEEIRDKVTVEGHTAHTGGTATCIALAKCAICGEEYGELGEHALNPTEAKAPTCTEDGNDAYWTCSVCAKMFSDANGTAEIKEINTIPKTGHTYSEAWDGDETYHWHSATCGHDSISDKEVHTWDEGIVTTEPTIDAEGMKIRTCEKCHATKTESIPQLAHTHTYSDEWTSDETNHWHNATCGHTTISGVAAHTEDSGKVTIPATAEAEGVKTFACTVCKRVMRTEPIPQLGEEHDHNFSTDWKHDETSHWHECDCGEATDISAHTDNGGIVTAPPTETSTGTMKYSCTVCGYVIRTEEIPALDPVIPDHSHSFGSEWEYDSAYHWHECNCGVTSDVANHISDSGKVTVQPTATLSGIRTYSCSVCGYLINTETIPATGNNNSTSSPTYPSVTPSTTVIPTNSTTSTTFNVKVDNRVTGENGKVKATRTGENVTINLGKDNNGYYANAYTSDGKVFEAVRITSGKAKFTIQSDVDFYIVIDKDSHLEYEDVSSDAGATDSGSPIDVASPVTNGVRIPQADLPRGFRVSNKKRRYRVLRKRRLDDLVFVF